MPSSSSSSLLVVVAVLVTVVAVVFFVVILLNIFFLTEPKPFQEVMFSRTHSSSFPSDYCEPGYFIGPDGSCKANCLAGEYIADGTWCVLPPPAYCPHVPT